METSRKRMIMFRFSLASAILIALFWTAWYFIAGQVPEVSSIKLAENWAVDLPFSISRWWDVLMGPVWSVMLVLIFTSEKIEEDENLFLSISAAAFFGIIAGFAATDMVFGLAFGLAFGLVLSLAFSFISVPTFWFDDIIDSLATGIADGLKFGLSFSLGFSLVLGLTYGLVFNLAFGLAFGLIIGLAYSLVHSLTFGLAIVLNRLCYNRLFYKYFWLKLSRWLLAK